MRESYYNTTHQRGRQLTIFDAKARTQDDIILDWFRRGPPFAAWAPSTVHEFAPLADGTPLTSVRRSINTLTRKGYLEKTDECADGPYGRPEYMWRLVAPAPDKSINPTRRSGVDAGAGFPAIKEGSGR